MGPQEKGGIQIGVPNISRGSSRLQHLPHPSRSPIQVAPSVGFIGMDLDRLERRSACEAPRVPNHRRLLGPSPVTREAAP